MGEMKMFISTSTNIHGFLKSGRVAPVEECVEKCYRVGFRNLDINFCDNAIEGMPLAQDGWEAWAEGLKRQADRLGMRYPIAHAPFYNVCEPDTEKLSLFYPGREIQEERVRRALIAAGIMGVDWIVFHAGSVNHGADCDKEESLKRNQDYFGHWLTFAKQCGVGLALENMGRFDVNYSEYTASVDNLIELVDSFNDPRVGICWDFGHANLTDENQAESLRKVGGRLKVTHVADNHGMWDEHLAPGYGDVRWDEVMPVLEEIGYAGGFNYEIHRFTGPLPDEVRQDSLNELYALARKLVESKGKESVKLRYVPDGK